MVSAELSEVQGVCMMRYYLYLLPYLVTFVLCYLTNWVVVLFADEAGELHGALRLWQTWDDTLDNSTFIKSLPSFLQYDWDEHYLQYATNERGRTRYKETLIKPFTPKEKLKRYFCRVLWLMRNNAYGFAFYVFGHDINGEYTYSKNEPDYYAVKDSGGAWAVKDDRKKGNSHGSYYGWKINRHTTKKHRAMYAFRFAFKRG